MPEPTRRPRLNVPEDIYALLRAYEKANPLNPRTGAPWGSSVETLYFAFRSAVRGDNLDPSLLKGIVSLPAALGNFKAPQGRPKKQLSKGEL